MNAYQLAEELNKYKGIATQHASLMLRHQADQLADQKTTINFLEAELSALRIQINELLNQG